MVGWGGGGGGGAGEGVSLCKLVIRFDQEKGKGLVKTKVGIKQGGTSSNLADSVVTEKGELGVRCFISILAFFLQWIGSSPSALPGGGSHQTSGKPGIRVPRTMMSGTEGKGLPQQDTSVGHPLGSVPVPTDTAGLTTGTSPRPP